MASENTPLTRVKTRALELGVYLPLGAYARARDQISDLDSKTLGRVVDDLIKRGRARMTPVERVITRRTEDAGVAVEDAARQVQKTARKTATRAAQASKAPRMPRVAAPKTAGDVPIDGYDKLTANEIVASLRGLTQTDLAKVYKFERANEKRTTILDAIESRLVELPIALYDTMTAEEINDRLGSLSEEELKAVRRYESETKNRSTVLDKIDALLA